MQFTINHSAQEGWWQDFKNAVITRWFNKPMTVHVSSAVFGNIFNFEPIIDDGNYVIIKNFPYVWFMRLIKKQYGSIKISHMLQVMGIDFGIFTGSTRKIRIHKFFLPEIVYLLSQGNGGRANQNLIDNIVARTWLRDLYADTFIENHADLSLVARDMDVKLFDWQTEFIQQYDERKQRAHLNGELLSFGCGLGKTITSLALMKALNCDGVIVLAPKSTLQDVWVDHLKRFFRKQPKYFLVNEEEPHDADYFIFNYESMDKIDSVMKYIRKKKNIGIIVDESHNFLKMKSLRTQNLIKLREDTGCKNVLLQSGTPVKALGVEVIPLLKIIDGFFDDEAEALFRKAFGLNTTLGGDILHARMNLMMHRRKMEDVFELPPKVESTMEIKIKDGNKYCIENVKKLLMTYMQERMNYHHGRWKIYEEEWKRCIEFFDNDKRISGSVEYVRYTAIVKTLRKHGYDRFNADLRKDIEWANSFEKDVLIPALPKNLKDEFLDCKSAIKYLGLKVQGEVLGHLDHIRAEMITSMLNGVDFNAILASALKKVIFFTSYVDTVEELEKILKEKGIKSISVYGKTSKDAPALLDKFRKDKNIQVLIATMQTLATGVTLTEANTAVFCNLPWREADREQASNRIWRIGQDTECNVITLHLDTGSTLNLSDRTQDILDWSKRLTLMIVDGMET